MAKIVGRGMLAPYSCDITLSEPTSVCSLPELLGLPEQYHEEIIAVRGNQVLSRDDTFENGNTILVFVAVMGG